MEVNEMRSRFPLHDELGELFILAEEASRKAHDRIGGAKYTGIMMAIEAIGAGEEYRRWKEERG